MNYGSRRRRPWHSAEERNELLFYDFAQSQRAKESRTTRRCAAVFQAHKWQSFWVRDRVLNFRCCPSQGTRGAHSKRLVARDARSTMCGVGILSRGVACGERGAVSDDVWRAAGVEVLWVKSCLVVRGIDKTNVCMMHVALFSDCIGI